jgi:hypothetical protein
MSAYVVIGTAPVVDTSVVVGPFRSIERASAAWDALTAKGWNAELCTLATVAEVESVDDWSEGEGS